MEITRSLQEMASNPTSTTITAEIELIVPHEAVMAKLVEVPGETLELKRVAVREWLNQQIEAAFGSAFLPQPGGPLIQEVDFDTLTGRLKILGVVGGELVQTGE